MSTRSYTNGNSKVSYFPSGYSPINKEDGSTATAAYLIVESDDTDWPYQDYRTLELDVTPKGPGSFQIHYRFWLCGDQYNDCARGPGSNRVDQQGWDAGLYTVDVTSPSSDDFARNSAEEFDTLDAADNEHPTGIWSDETTMWVADSSDDKIYAYSMSTKARVSSKDFDTLDAADNESPTGIWSDETTMWVADPSDDKIYAYSMSTKARVSSKDFDTLDAAENERPTGIWSDGTTMWVADSSDDKIYAYSMSTKARVSSKDFDTLDAAENERPEGIWSDGTTMWAADSSDDKIYAYSMSTKARVSSKDFDTLDAADNESPEGIWSDGTTMWVADYSDDKIYAYNAPAATGPPANSPPSVMRVPASPSSLSLYTGNSQTFTARASDPDNDLKRYEWFVNDQSEDSGVWRIFLPTGPVDKSFSHTFAAAGTYTVTATFTDDDASSASVSWTVQVTDNRAPTVTGTPSTQQTLSLTTGGSQTFGVSATDPDNNLSKWEWEASRHRPFLPDERYTEPEESFAPAGDISKSFSYTFATAGDWTVTATFTDSKGETGSAEWRVEVEDPPNRIPSLTRVSPGLVDYVPTGEVTFVASASDPDDNLKRYEWSVNGTSEEDGSWLLVLPTATVTKSFTHTFATVGVYTVQVVFTDDEGLSAAIRWRITVVDPVAVQLGAASYAVNEDDGEVDVTVTISASPYRLLLLRLTTSDGTAESVSDYGSLSNRSVSFLSGTTTLTQTFTVPITDNSYVEPTEDFTVELEPGVGGLPLHMSLTRSEATVTIHDDDQATVQFSREGFTLPESSLRFQTLVEVESDTPSSCPVHAPFGVHLSHLAPDGTSSSGPSVPSSVTFQHCQRVRDFRVDIQDLSGTGPGVLTGTTEVVFTLDGVSSASPGVASRVRIGEISTQTVAIQDNDEVTLRFKNTYLITREREQFDICVVKVAYPSVRIARPFTAHFSYSDPDRVLSTESMVPSSVTLDAGDTEGCATVHVGDVGQAGASVSFTLNSVTSTGSDVASRVVISGSSSEMEVRVEDSVTVTDNRAPTVTGTPPTQETLSLATGDSQTFQVSATDADNNLTKWKWEVDKHFSLFHGHQEPEETFAATSSITKTFSHTFPDDGTYTVTATFTDSEGEFGSVSWPVEISPRPTSPGNCLQDLGTLTGQVTPAGEWTDDCASTHRDDSYARFYSFTLDAEREAVISLESSVDTYLYLLRGADSGGEVIWEHDDVGDVIKDGSDSSRIGLRVFLFDVLGIVTGDTDSAIVRTLGAGTYTIEATTYESRKTGTFDLTVREQRPLAIPEIVDVQVGIGSYDIDPNAVPYVGRNLFVEYQVRNAGKESLSVYGEDAAGQVFLTSPGEVQELPRLQSEVPRGRDHWRPSVVYDTRGGRLFAQVGRDSIERFSIPLEQSGRNTVRLELVFWNSDGNEIGRNVVEKETLVAESPVIPPSRVVVDGVSYSVAGIAGTSGNVRYTVRDPGDVEPDRLTRDKAVLTAALQHEFRAPTSLSLNLLEALGQFSEDAVPYLKVAFFLFEQVNSIMTFVFHPSPAAKANSATAIAGSLLKEFILWASNHPEKVTRDVATKMAQQADEMRDTWLHTREETRDGRPLSFDRALEARNILHYHNAYWRPSARTVALLSVPDYFVDGNVKGVVAEGAVGPIEYFAGTDFLEGTLSLVDAASVLGDLDIALEEFDPWNEMKRDIKANLSEERTKYANSLNRLGITDHPHFELSALGELEIRHYTDLSGTSATGDCFQELGTVAGEVTRTGQWTGDCASTHEDGSYGRFYSFTVGEETEVTISLESSLCRHLPIPTEGSGLGRGGG